MPCNRCGRGVVDRQWRLPPRNTLPLPSPTQVSLARAEDPRPPSPRTACGPNCPPCRRPARSPCSARGARRRAGCRSGKARCVGAQPPGASRRRSRSWRGRCPSPARETPPAGRGRGRRATAAPACPPHRWSDVEDGRLGRVDAKVAIAALAGLVAPVGRDDPVEVDPVGKIPGRPEEGARPAADVQAAEDEAVGRAPQRSLGPVHLILGRGSFCQPEWVVTAGAPGGRSSTAATSLRAPAAPCRKAITCVPGAVQRRDQAAARPSAGPSSGPRDRRLGAQTVRVVVAARADLGGPPGAGPLPASATSPPGGRRVGTATSAGIGERVDPQPGSEGVVAKDQGADRRREASRTDVTSPRPSRRC